MKDRRGLLLAMSGSVAMVFLDQTVVGVALDSLGDELRLGQTALEWVVTAYLLAFGSLVQVGGYLGDRLGQRRTFLAGVAVFSASSILVGLAAGSTSLLLGRALQGVGAALMQPASLALVTSAFPREVRGQALSTYYNAGSAALVAGPVLGGALTEWVGWRWVFLLNVPVALATVAAALAQVPPDVRREPGERFDTSGATLLVVGLTALVLGLQQGPAWGWTSPATLAALAVGAVALALMVRHERAEADPVLDLRLLADRVFTADILSVVVVRFALVGVTVFVAVWLQRQAGLGATAAGLVLLPSILVLVVATNMAGRLLDRHGPRGVNGAGLALMALGHGAALPALAGTSWLALVPGTLVVGLGAGLATAANTDAVSRSTPEARGRAAAMVQTLRQVGGAVGVPVVGVVAAGPGLPASFGMLAGVLGLSAAAVFAMQAGAEP